MEGKPDYEPVVTKYYQIAEGAVIKSIFKRGKKNSVGKEVFVKQKQEDSNTSKQVSKPSWYNRVLSIGKRHHWRWMFWLRELSWKFGNVNYDGMMKFINDFNPDLFFLPYNHIFYTNRLAIYIKKRLHHQLPEFTQTHIHQVGDAIQPSHPLSSPFPPALNPSQHQSLFQ